MKMNRKIEKFTIIYGHYGCGKTNLSLNLALSLANQGEKVTLVDLDVVNPYFRSGDYKEMLAEKGIDVIYPESLGTNLDTPALSAKIYSIFLDSSRYVIVDVGGDDAGAYALGRFSREIKNLPKYNAFYVINKNRALTSTPEETAQLLKEIEYASKIKATGIINNTHMQNLTTELTIYNSVEYANKTAKILNLPIVFTTCPKDLAKNVSERIENVFAVDAIVKPPF